MSKPESQVHHDPLVEELIEELRDRMAFLKRSLERRSVEAECYQQIVAGLTQTNNQLASRLRELEAPSVTSEGVEEDLEGAESPGPAPKALRRPERDRRSRLAGGPGGESSSGSGSRETFGAGGG